MKFPPYWWLLAIVLGVILLALILEANRRDNRDCQARTCPEGATPYFLHDGHWASRDNRCVCLTDAK